MPTRLPPRREPRVLAVAKRPPSLLWAVADPWELRGSGTLDCTKRSETLALRRLIRREKPTVIVAANDGLEDTVRRASRGSRVPFVRATTDLPPTRIAADLYPELPLFAPMRPLSRTARVAIATVLHSFPPPRPYAPRRHRTIPRSA